MRHVISFTTVALVGLSVGLATIAVADDPAITREQERLGIDPAAAIEQPAVSAERLTVIGATLILQDGDTPAGAPSGISLINPPVSDGAGKVGFTGDEAANDDFVWYDAGIAWSNSDAAGFTLTGAESTYGVGPGGAFIYSPAIDGDDGVWSQNGLVAVEGTQAPGQAAGILLTFASRPTMNSSGAAYWVSGDDDGLGGGSAARAFYTSSDATAANAMPLLQSGDLVGGFPIESGSDGIEFDYDVSGDGSHMMNELDLATGSTANDIVVYIDGAIAVQEGQPTGDGDNWAGNFDRMSINNSGDWLLSGDTDGDAGTDEFIAYNGTIVIREGDVIDGITLASAASVRFVALDNLGEAVHAWGVSGGAEHVFFACDGSDLATTSQILFSTGDEVDLDDNGTADATITDLGTPLHNANLDDTGLLFFEVNLDDGGGVKDSIIAIERPSCLTGGLVINEIDYDQAGTDTEEFIELYNASGAPINLDAYSLELVNGNGNTVYDTVDLPNVDLGVGEFFVVCANAATVPNCDLDDDPDTNFIQNGAPDAVGLKDGTGAIVDTVSYEGSVPGYTEGSGDGLEDLSGNDYFSISRTADGLDTDVNNVDFAGRCNSPGAPNLTTTVDCVMIPVELQSFSIE